MCLPSSLHRIVRFDLEPKIERDPMIADLVNVLGKVCDLAEREEKWALLKTLTEILVMNSYPVMMVDHGQTDNNQA